MFGILRRLVQILIICGLVVIPFISIYERLLYTLSYPFYGKLESQAEIIQNQLADLLINTSYMPIVIKLDKIFSSLIPSVNNTIALIDGFKGAPWTVTIGGLTISDPLAILSVILSTGEINLSLLSTIIIPILMALLLGRFFCGWLCPIRPILELTGFLRKHIINLGVKLPSYQLPTNISYFILIFGFIAALGGVLIFPFLVPYAIMSRTIFLWIFGLALSPVLFFVLALVLFELTIIPNQWCNSLCPTGTALGLLGRIRFLNIRAKEKSCLANAGCNQCAKACFMNIHPALEAQERLKSQCTSCGACIDACKTKSLSFRAEIPKLEINNTKVDLTVFKK